MPLIRLILGIDPGLRHTGWGIVAQEGNPATLQGSFAGQVARSGVAIAKPGRLSFIAAGRINPDAELPMAARLLQLADELTAITGKYVPTEAAIEESFVHKNVASALKLGQARGAAMLALAQAGLDVAEYSANRIKQSVTGYGHAEKTQIQAMVNMLLPGSGKLAADAADALAVAITHAHHASATTLKVRA